MAHDLAQVEVAREQVVRPVRAKDARAIHGQPARGGRAGVIHHRHEVAGARVAVERGLLLAINAAVNRVQQAVALAAAGLDERAAQEPLARRVERHAHGIVHATGEHGFKARAIGPRTEDVRGARDEGLAVRERVALLGERTFRPVNPAVWAEVGAVQVVCAAGERLAVMPHLALVGDAVAVGVGELPDLRRRGNVERAVVKHRALGEHHLVREDHGLVEASVTVRVLEAHDAVVLTLVLRRAFVAGAGGIGRVEPTLRIVGDGNGAVDERRPRDQLDRKAVGQGEVVVVEIGLRGVRSGGRNEGCDQNRARKSIHGVR